MDKYDVISELYPIVEQTVPTQNQLFSLFCESISD